MKKGNVGKKTKLVATLLVAGGFALLNPLQGHAEPSTEEKWDQYHSVQVSPEFLYGGFRSDEGYIKASANDNLVFKDDFLKIKEFRGEAFNRPASIDGFSVFKNLEVMTFEGGLVSDFRPIKSLKNVTHFNMFGSNNNTLIDFKDWDKIESFQYTETENSEGEIALTDISALSNKENLKGIKINTDGNLPTIKLSKRHNRYELFDPIILSDQFKSKIKYSNVSVDFNEDADSNEGDFTATVSEEGLITWENIPTTAANLKFIAEVGQYPDNYNYYGTISIPIKWVD